MTALPVSILSLLNPVPGQDSNAPSKEGKGGFQSLLDIAGGAVDDDAPEQGALADTRRGDDTQEPVASGVDVPTEIFTRYKGEAKPREDAPEAPASVKREALPEKPAPKRETKKADTPEERKETPVTEAKTTTEKTVQETAPAENDNALQDALKQEIRRLADILHSVMQMLAAFQQAGAVVILQTTTVVQTTSITAVAFSSSSLTALQAVNAGDAPIAADPLSQVTVPEGLVKRLQALLAALRSQGETGQLTPETEAQFATLEENVSSLLSFLKAATGGKPGAGASLTVTQADVLETRLADQVDVIKTLLPKFKAREFAAPVQSNDTTLTASVKPVVTMPDTGTVILPPQGAPVVQADTAVAAPNVTQTNTQIAAAAVQTAGTGNGADSGANDKPGDQPSQQQPQAIAGLRAASTANAASEVGSSTFARVLQRTASTPVAEQVVFHVKTAVSTGNSKISIQLDPESLGKLEIKLDVDASGKTTAVVTADNKQTLDMLQRDARGLERALADAGLKTDAGSLSFNLRGGQQEQNPQNAYATQNSYQKIGPEDELPPEAVLSRSYAVELADGLDIRI